MTNQASFIVLCAPTARSQAYLQAMQVADLAPQHILVYGWSNPRNVSNSRYRHDLDIFVPDFDVTLQQTINESGWDATYIDNDDIGGEEINHILQRLSPALTVFSGFGGQLVPSHTLVSAGNLLHVHSGWLPDYRGSTTIYYSLLNEKRCAATALLLTNNIDDGPILARKHYPAPTKNSDIDYAYDCSIRADLLSSVLKSYVINKALPEPITKESEGEMYYVIHPLLKHLAILSLKDK